MKSISRKGESLESSWSGKRGSNPRPSAWKADALPSELFPPLNSKRLYSSVPPVYLLVGRGGFEPPKAEPSDLQSDPFGHSGTSPENRRSSKNNHKSYQKNLAGTIDSPKPRYSPKPEWEKRAPLPAGYSGAGSGRGVPPWSWREDSNLRPADYKSAALPAELRQPTKAG